MKISVKDVMTTRFHTLTPEASVSDAVRALNAAAASEGRRVFGMMVTDAAGRLVGMLSMYDILLLLKPKHIHIWGKMEDIDIAGLLETTLRQAKAIRVGDIMSTDLITVTPETHLLVVLDLMIARHVRRIPVIGDGAIQGIVYLSDVFYHLMESLA